MKRFLKWVAIVVGTLVLLIALLVGSLVAWLKWSSDRDWKAAAAELKAKGEKLTFAELVPPMPPESENFFADPLWTGYSDLVRQTNSYGMEKLVPRLPSDQQPLWLWQKVPLSAQELEQLAQMTGKATSSPAPDRISAFGDLRSLNYKETNVDKKKAEAELMLQILAPASDTFAHVAELAKRPSAQFPLHYDLLAQEGTIPDLSVLNPILKLSQLIMKRAMCELLLGKNAEAAADTATLLRLSFILENQPILISLLVRISTTDLALASLNQGIADHAWNTDQLAEFQSLLGRIDLQKSLLFSLRGERIFFRESLKSNIRSPAGLLSSLVYHGWVLLLEKDSAFHALSTQDALEKLGDRITNTGWNSTNSTPFKSEQDTLAKNPFHRVMSMLVVLSIQFVDGSIEKAAEYQTLVEQSLIACASERYRLSHGSYPASLDYLVPQFIAKLPNSPINGKPMSYALKQDGTFSLWSVGWNLKSLDGKVGKFRGDGDIVWKEKLPLGNPPRDTNRKDN